MYRNEMMTSSGHYGNTMQLPSISELQSRPKRQAVLNRPRITDLDGSDVDDDLAVDVQGREDQDHVGHQHNHGQSMEYPT